MTKYQKNTRFNKTLLATMIGFALAPQSVWALDLAQSPPGSVEPYVAPNLIISVDDSGSMNFRIDAENANNATNNLTPTGPNNTWPASSRRMNVLKYALDKVFDDKTLLPDGKIRLSWQAMWNNGKSPGVGAKKSISGTTSNGGANDVSSTSMGINSMRILDSTHRTNFSSFIESLTPLNGTPSHLMFSQADSYLRLPLSTNGPWASTPGTSAGNTYLGCRRNYHVMMTDGRWNSNPTGGNTDGVRTLTLPDGTIFKDTAQTKLYRDSQSNTLADWAFKSWSQNLQPSLYDENVKEKQVPLSKEYRQAPPTENFGKDGDKKDAILEKYWNPRYDPANWPHLVTYTIGFSASSYTWPGASSISAPTAMVPFGYDGSFPNFVTGKITWPAMDAENVRALDLWHSALNGRGRFFAVQKGEDLEAAFRSIIQAINVETEPDRGSVATSGSSTSRNGVNLYIANYDPSKSWRGWISAETINPDETRVPTVSWAGKTTATWLDATGFNVGNRLVLSWGDSQKTGVSFKWSTTQNMLSTAQKAYFNVKADNTTDTLGEDRLNYIRGDQTKEGTDNPLSYTTAKPFRQRASRQGDMVNSSVWFVGSPVSNYSLNGYKEFVRAQLDRDRMIYVGGNDGMLHGFSAVDGQEKIAYVPRGVIPSLASLTYTTYNDNHRYFVDGSPMSGDVNLAEETSNTPDWRTMLVSSLGGGGKGYFVLDITKPGSTFIENNAASLVVMDKTLHSTETFAADCSTLADAASQKACSDNKDIGHVFAAPVLDDANQLRTTQIVRMNNNRWAAVMGNGYNSTNQRPVLLIQFLDGAKELVRLVATKTTATGASLNTTDNGLSAPRVVDINGDGKPDVVYAGDLKGNMWKFMVASPDPANWGVAFNGVALYKASGPSVRGSDRNQDQPITAPPTVRANDRKKTVTIEGQETTVNVGGMMVAFGTGMNVTRADPENTKVQTVYSVLDNTNYKLVDGHIQVCETTGDTVCKIRADMVPATVPGISSLAKQAFDDVATVGTNNNNQQRSFWGIDSANSQDVNWSTHKGWYMDLPLTSERVLKQMGFYDASNLLAIFSQIPAKGSNDKAAATTESCTFTTVDKETQYLSIINIMDGKKPSVPVMDSNFDGSYTTVDKGPRVQIAPGAQTLLDTGKKIRPSNDDIDFALLPEQSVRPTWRQLR